MSVHSRPTQCQLILDYIAEFGSITPLEAMRDLGCYRLASRISEMKKKGFHIKSEWETVQTRRGTKSRIKRYTVKIESPIEYEMPYSAGMHGTVKRGDAE